MAFVREARRGSSVAGGSSGRAGGRRATGGSLRSLVGLAVRPARFDADGRVIDNVVYYDGATFAREIGMLPRRDSAADRAMLHAFNATTKAKRRFRRDG